jgi:hypothetical protein
MQTTMEVRDVSAWRDVSKVAKGKAADVRH